METHNDVKLWSLLLKPGSPVSVTPSHSIRIANAALAFDLQDPHGRSTLMLTYDDGRADMVLCSLFGRREVQTRFRPFHRADLSMISQMENSTLNIILGEGNSFIFTLRGKNDVYLTGNVIPKQSPLAPVSSRADGHRGGVSDHPRQAKRLKRPAPEPDVPPPALKESPVATKAAENEKRHPVVSVAEKEKFVIDKGKAKSSAPSVTIKDGIVGMGPMATLGSKVEVNYLMRLTNNTVVQDFQHKTISFVVGHGEVIKGWDDNIVGMRAGAHRQLVIPPELAYEDKGCGSIGPGEVVVVDFVVINVSGSTGEQTEGRAAK